MEANLLESDLSATCIILSDGLNLGFDFWVSSISARIESRISFAVAVPSILVAVIAAEVLENDFFCVDGVEVVIVVGGDAVKVEVGEKIDDDRRAKGPRGLAPAPDEAGTTPRDE